MQNRMSNTKNGKFHIVKDYGRLVRQVIHLVL